MVVFWRLTLLFNLLLSGVSYAQKLKVACIGNSVTAGYLLADSEKQSYPSKLQTLLGDKYVVGNFGHSGATLLKMGHNPYYKTKEFIETLKFNPDIAIIHLGLNDTDPRNWPNYNGAFLADYNWLIDTLRRVNPKMKIYVCKLTPIFSGHPRFKSGTRDWYWQIQEKISILAKTSDVSLIDLNAALSKRSDLFRDNLHPDSVGASIISKTVYGKITGNYGGFRLNPLFANNMVLQRDKPISIFGTANVNDEILITLNKVTKKVIADENGKWQAKFPAMHYGGPYSIIAKSGLHSITLQNILIGDIWLCSGQSNMAFQLKASATANHTLKNLDENLKIRLLKFNPVAETDNVAWDASTLAKVNNLDYFSGNWENHNEKAVSNFSAIAYYFGAKLANDEKIPIGLIQMAVGGSTLESWIDRETLEKDNLLVDMLSTWRKSDFIQDWVRGRADINLKNSDNPKQRHPYQPAYNYEAGISELINFPIKGVIWHQGESNAHNVELFNYEFPILVKSWREKWGYNFPFYYVQLSSIDRPSWPYFRDAQSKLQSVIPNSGMAVSSDLGDSLNVHPTRKKEIGERLALLAEKGTYNKNIVANGPVAIKAVQIKDKILINFTNATYLKANGSTTLTGFEAEDRKGNRVFVTADIIHNTVQLNLPSSTKISKIYYAWQPFTRANLVNQAALPASTFSIPVQ